MHVFDQQYLDKIFVLNPSNPRLIGSRESTTLEFKKSFILDDFSVAGFSKAMASFANKDGGYIVFGVDDNPRTLLGVKRTKFDSYDPAKLSEKINELFNPTIEWETHLYDWEGMSFGIIYTYKSKEKPIIAIKNASEITEGDIYYRYNGKSERIKPRDLSKIIHERLKEQDDAWRGLFEKAASIGPVNAALMDTIGGTVSGPEGTLVIDEELIPKLKFIREGKFSEKEGKPTLKLIGDVIAAPVAAIKEKKVTIGEDIYTYRPGLVAKKVEAETGREFSTNLHTKAWKMYKVRPQRKQKYKTQYCEFKDAENEYRYSEAWVKFLIDKLKDEDNYKKLLAFKVR